jgi:probable rRNA maturation factor
VNVDLDVQLATSDAQVPDDESFRRWAALALIKKQTTPPSVVIRIIDEDESRRFNSEYRQRDYPTNVLSFPFEAPEFVEEHHLGDLLICAQVVNREAREQHKSFPAHWAHMVIHGMLHLQGYDHISEAQAMQMESLEIELLKQLDIVNPYEE